MGQTLLGASLTISWDLYIVGCMTELWLWSDGKPLLLQVPHTDLVTAWAS